MEGLSQFVEIEYLHPETARFSRTPGGFLSLTLGEKTYPRVTLMRTFPFTYRREYISVRELGGKENKDSKESTEIGMIRSLDSFPREVVAWFEEELDRRYFAPVITRIISMKEEFGYAYWDVETDSGRRRFTVRDMQQSVWLLSPEHVYIVDVDGNRFDIPNYQALEPASRKIIDDLL